ncbi:MAG TPA: SprT family zinc-dependent metalloprotease [Coriobacteriia bacterium]|nr:SprT family zinc-dependent metalloprotease [Coriobacteriia bacterium]
MTHLAPQLDYTVRRSARAKRVRLTVTPQHGLVVVVPNRWRGNLDAIVASKREWASRALAKVAERRAEYLAEPETLLPEMIELRALTRSLPVSYKPTAATTARAREHGGVLVVSGCDEPEARLAALRRWLTAEAKRMLPERLADIARVRAVEPPAEIRVSAARSRWGSCSSGGRISLNRTLLFIPPELCDYVIAHELAHLAHMDHSPRFWAHLASMDERALEHRAAMKDAASCVPVWVDA